MSRMAAMRYNTEDKFQQTTPTIEASLRAGVVVLGGAHHLDDSPMNVQNESPKHE